MNAYLLWLSIYYYDTSETESMQIWMIFFQYSIAQYLLAKANFLKEKKKKTHSIDQNMKKQYQ